MVNYVMNPGRKSSGKKRTRSRSTYCSKSGLHRLSRMRKKYKKLGGSISKYSRKVASCRRMREKAGTKRYVSSWMARIARVGKREERKAKKLAAAEAAGPKWEYKTTGDNPRRSRFGYHGRNPTSAITGSLMSGFSLEPIKVALPLIGGMVIGNQARRFIGGQSWTPSFLQSGKYGNLALGVALSGVASMLMGKFMPKYSSAVLIGGVTEAVVGLANNIFGRTVLSDCRGCAGLGCIGCGALLAGGTGDGGVMFDNEVQELPSAVGQVNPADMTSVDADVLDAFSAEDVF